MQVTSTYETSGLDIRNGKKVGARMRSGDEPRRSSVLPDKEPTKRGRQQKPRGHGEWKKRNKPPERKQSARGRGRREPGKLKSVLVKLDERHGNNKSRRQRRGCGVKRKGRQKGGLKKRPGESGSSRNE